MSPSSDQAERRGLSTRRIFETWWPLATSWLLMSVELPVLSAVVARLDDPAIHLAALGGVVFPLALLIESPIIMLLAASTALSRDWTSYAKLRRFAHGAGFVLTLLHVAVAFTPLYDLVVEYALRAPAEIREPARLGLQIMTPWTWSIAYRRFHQGVLIRYGRSRVVGLGTGVRLISDGLVLLAGYLSRDYPGIVVATSAMATGVLCEAWFIGLRVRPVLRDRLPRLPDSGPPLTRRGFLVFYVPLAMTSLLHMLMEPIGAAAMGRMPRALECLAVWPVLFGLVWMAMSLGVAFNEVVVALVGEPGGERGLRHFASRLAVLGVLPLFLLALTPALSSMWFEGICGLPPELARLAQRGLWFALPLPVLSVVHSWYQGLLVHSRSTRGIPESVALFLVTASLLAVLGVVWGRAPGLYVVLSALAVGACVQATWLRRRARGLRVAS